GYPVVSALFATKHWRGACCDYLCVLHAAWLVLIHVLANVSHPPERARIPCPGAPTSSVLIRSLGHALSAPIDRLPSSFFLGFPESHWLGREGRMVSDIMSREFGIDARCVKVIPLGGKDLLHRYGGVGGQPNDRFQLDG